MPYTAICVGVVSTPAVTPILLKPEILEKIRKADDMTIENCSIKKDMETMSADDLEELVEEACLKDDRMEEKDELNDGMEFEEKFVRTEINKRCETDVSCLSKDDSASSADQTIFQPAADGDSDAPFSMDDLPVALEVMEKQALEKCTITHTTPPCLTGERRKRQEDEEYTNPSCSATNDNAKPSRASSKFRRRRKKIKLASIQSNDSTASPKKPGRRAPNAFVAVRVSSPEVHSKVAAMQEEMARFDSNLSATMVSTKKLHLTLMVMALESDDDIEK